MKNIIIVGAGSVGGHIAANPELYGLAGQIEAFVDDDSQKHGKYIYNIPVIGSINDVLSMGKKRIIIGIAFPRVKSSILYSLIQSEELEFPTLISSKSWISNDCKIGRGSIIYPGTSINYGSKIGEFCVVNMNCAIGHHVTIGNFTSFAPGVNIGGNCTIGELSDIGIGASVVQNIIIGSNTIIGGQTMVLKNVQNDSLLVGVPGKMITKK